MFVISFHASDLVRASDDQPLQALLLCFRLQESRIAVVSSTAAATLRQLVMFVFDKVVDLELHSDADTDSTAEG